MLMPTGEPLTDPTKIWAQASAHIEMFFFLLTKKRCSCSTQRQLLLKKKKRVTFLIMFPLQTFPAGLGFSNNHPSINSTTSVRSVPLHCSWLAAQFQNVSTHATKFQPLLALQVFSLLI